MTDYVSSRMQGGIKDTLVKYESPILVSSSAGAKTAGKKGTKIAQILNSILPPREDLCGDQLWIRYVSSTPATKADVVALQEALDHALKTRQARETGICPIREELYAECFDELIRQITINCSERGMLLLQVRDEIRMTISAYQSLYESSVAFGMRKALHAEQERKENQAENANLIATNRKLQDEAERLEQEIAQLEQREIQTRETAEKKHNEEVSSLKKNILELRDNIESLLTTGTAGRK